MILATTTTTISIGLICQLLNQAIDNMTVTIVSIYGTFIVATVIHKLLKLI